MIMMYGTDLCPDCVAAKFLKLRDTKDAFQDVRGSGTSIGIPALIISPTEITLDWEGYIRSQK